MRPELLGSIAISCVLVGLFITACNTTPKRRAFAPYIVKTSDGWVYRLDNATGVTHESAFASDTPAEALGRYTRLRAFLSHGGEPIVRTDTEGNERWYIETDGAVIDHAEQDFPTPSAALRNFKVVKDAVMFFPSPRVRKETL